ncbi:C-type lectin 37Da-like, partial [Saccostrea cucullata]|uniref:C-type lectin 37Da-like n=1 Tax=Saccostrea cuccullata TaxID=36930 RepID=UPI002ED2F549
SECERKCSHLVEIATKEESDWLAETFLFKGTCSSNIYRNCVAWTGGNDISVEGRYHWSYFNTSINFTNWKSNEPGPLRLKEDCIHLLRN